MSLKDEGFVSFALGVTANKQLKAMAAYIKEKDGIVFSERLFAEQIINMTFYKMLHEAKEHKHILQKAMEINLE